MKNGSKEMSAPFKRSNIRNPTTPSCPFVRKQEKKKKESININFTNFNCQDSRAQE